MSHILHQLNRGPLNAPIYLSAILTTFANSSFCPFPSYAPVSPGTTTGISAHDRSLTARALASPHVHATDFNRPGHLVPLRAREGGVLTRKGHTEASVDLCLMTNQTPAGVLCELVNDDLMGTMARRDDCRAFADRWGLKMISVDMLAEWKRKAWLPQQQGRNGAPAQL